MIIYKKQCNHEYKKNPKTCFAVYSESKVFLLLTGKLEKKYDKCSILCYIDFKKWPLKLEESKIFKGNKWNINEDHNKIFLSCENKIIWYLADGKQKHRLPNFPEYLTKPLVCREGHLLFGACFEEVYCLDLLDEEAGWKNYMGIANLYFGGQLLHSCNYSESLFLDLSLRAFGKGVNPGFQLSSMDGKLDGQFFGIYKGHFWMSSRDLYYEHFNYYAISLASKICVKHNSFRNVSDYSIFL